jgi:(p)ppGpp synthase/HD superfamily hydrolase
MIFEAIEFAAAAHRGQYRKGTRIPYIIHPLNAARTLIEAGCGEPLVVAAILHDVVEDTPRTLEEIRSRFGARVADLVESATEPHRWATWEQRKRHTIEHLRTADDDMLLVAIADKLDNIRALRDDLSLRGEETWKRFKRGRKEQGWYYTSMAEVFAQRLAAEPGVSLASLFCEEVRVVFNGSSGSSGS